MGGPNLERNERCYYMAKCEPFGDASRIWTNRIRRETLANQFRSKIKRLHRLFIIIL